LHHFPEEARYEEHIQPKLYLIREKVWRERERESETDHAHGLVVV
jgi:hypothetical protein